MDDPKAALAQYKQYVAANPDDRMGARESFYDTFGIDPEESPAISGGKTAGQGLTDQERTFRRRYADALAAQSKDAYAQDITNAKTEFAGQAAAAIPVAAVSLGTGGLGAPAAMAVMGGAGALGGAYREGVKYIGGSTDIPKTGADLAKTLSLDAIMGAAGEGLGRGIGFATRSLAPKLLQRAAAQYEAGVNLLEKAFVDTREQLTGAIRAAGRPSVDVGNTLTTLYGKLTRLPRGSGKFAHRFSDPTSKAAEIIGLLEDDMAASGGSVAAMQPLDSLVRIKGSLQQMAWKEKGLAAEERQAFKVAAAELDKSIRASLKNLGPEATELYDTSLQLMKTQKEHDAAVSIAERALKTMGGKAMALGGAGGAYGYYKEGGLTGALKGAAEGAALGVALGSANAAAAKAIPWTLEMVMTHPQAAKVFKNAIANFADGRESQAMILATRAFGMAGVRERIKEWLGPMGERVKAEAPEKMVRPPDAAKAQ